MPKEDLQEIFWQYTAFVHDGTPRADSEYINHFILGVRLPKPVVSALERNIETAPGKFPELGEVRSTAAASSAVAH